MKVCLDYQPAVAQCAGIGRYTRVLAEELSVLMPAGDELALFYYDFKKKFKKTGREIRPTFVPFRLLPGRVMETAMNWLGVPKFDWIAGRADVYHFTNFIAKKVGRGKSVATVHDMSFVRFPEFADKKNLLYLERGLKRTAEEASLIITISDFSRREIEEILPETRGRVRTVPLGISEEFKPAGAGEIDRVKRELGLTRPFILTVGTVEPRKNPGFLVDVFERVAGEGVDLVVAGAPGWKCGAIMERFGEVEKRYPGKFHYVRHVPEGRLSALYSAASLFAVASHYEGFGFPPLEALACGTPVVSSEGGALAEVLGGTTPPAMGGENAKMRKCENAKIMRGFDADEWAGAVLGIIANPPDPAAGIKHAAKYRWSKCAEETLAIYREVCGA